MSVLVEGRPAADKGDSPRSARVAAKHAEIRSRIFDVSMAILLSQGHGALKARDVARAADCSLGIFYTVVKDMDEVALHLKDLALSELEAALLDAIGAVPAAPASAPDRLLALAQAYAAFARDQQNLWGMLFRHRIQAEALPEWYVARLDAIFGYIEEPLAEIAPQCGEAARKGFGRALFSAVHGIVSIGLEEKLGVVPRQDLHWRLRAVVASVISGLSWDGTTILGDEGVSALG